MSKTSATLSLCSNLKDIIQSHFKGPISIAFAYGSKVFKQASTSANSMVDIVVAVPDAQQFHKTQISARPNDYSFAGRYIMNTERLSKRIQSSGGGMYYVPFVRSVHGFEFKYGIIEQSELVDDLCNWSNLYVAGRLQKPVLFCKLPNKSVELDILRNALQWNLKNALNLAILLHPPNKPILLTRLFETICSISYVGDCRMMLAEKRNKVANIVQGAIEHFIRL
ncbi:hypothetical protein ACOME3_000126 [Neoechinorhynchus agilis]